MLMRDKARILIVFLMAVGFTALHYPTSPESHYLQTLYRGLCFIPVILGGFWFGVRGGLAASLVTTLLYVPHVWLAWNVYPVLNMDRGIDMVLYNVVAVIIGVLSDRQKAEQNRARDAENLAAVGKAVSALAHDMKIPLTAIGGFSILVRKHVGEENPYRDKLDIVIDETRRLENMVKDMLDFSRPLELQRSLEDVGRIVDECLEVVSDTARRENVRLKSELGSDLMAVYLDRMRIKQALINLIVNAIQASPAGETVTVRCSELKRKLIIEVIDCGCGIPLDRREDIFTPFFTTKKEGTGLGLPIVRKILEAHRGGINILDNQKNGIIFRLVIPTGRK